MGLGNRKDWSKVSSTLVTNNPLRILSGRRLAPPQQNRATCLPSFSARYERRDHSEGEGSAAKKITML